MKRLPVAAVSFLLIALIGSAMGADNKPPGKMTFQGFLTDSSGNPLGGNAPTNLTVFFRLYSSATGTNKVWAEKQVVTVDRGHFSVLLGEGIATGDGNDPQASPDISPFFVGADASDRFIGVQVQGQTEIAPRMQFFAAPYAQLAQYANNLVSPGGVSILNANAAGNIGIGTTSPDRKLSIGDDGIIGSEGMIRLESRSTLSGNASRAWDIGVPQAGVSGLNFIIDDPATGTIPEFLIQRVTGYVGIGKTNPASLLDVNGSITAVGISSSTFTGGAFNGNGAGLTGLNASSLTTGTISSDRLPDTISGDRTFSGNIGISFRKKLDLGAGSARADAYNSTISSGLVSGNALDIVGGSAGGIGERQIIFHNQGYAQFHGSIGIGTVPRCPLDVKGSAGILVPGHAYLNLSGVGGHFIQENSYPYTIMAEGRVGANEFTAFSDARIKKIVRQSDTREDLAVICRLRVTDYRAKDEVADGTNLRKGFIAQEVETIIPEAVVKSTNWVPNIYATAAAVKVHSGNQTLALALTNAHGLKKGDLVRLFTEAGNFERPVSAILSTNEFLVSNWTNDVKQVFVYGKQADDFRSVNYDRIFTTGVGAIQELAARLDEKSEQITALEKKVADLEKLVTKLASLQQGKARVEVSGQSAEVNVAAK